MEARFDLATALAAWRQFQARRHRFLDEDLDELEVHLRAHTAELRRQGWPAEAAFREAVRSLGDLEEDEAEYRKIYWNTLKHRHKLTDELRWRFSMFKNYLKIAWRHVLREKGYAFINVFGLAMGLAVCTLIFLYVRDELTYDRFHTDHDRIYRVSHPYYDEDGGFDGFYPYEPAPLGAAMQAEVPEVEAYVRFYELPSVVGNGTDIFQQKILFADPSVLRVFTFPLLRGDPGTALAALNSVVLSEAAAQKYFGQQDPLGATIRIRLGEQFETFTVTGLARPIPGNSSIRFDVLVPYTHLYAAAGYEEDDWRNAGAVTYVRLARGAERADVEAKLVPFRRLHYPWEAEEEREGRPPVRFILEPIADTHLNTRTTSGLTPASDPLYCILLGGIALFVLAIACINFMTLAIGRSAGRAREVAVRKVVGAVRPQLMGQFWGEALLLTLFALGLGLLLAWLGLPIFNVLAEKELQFDFFGDAFTLPALLALMLVTGLIAGSYPALVLSGIKPVEMFKRTFRLGGSYRLTNLLVGVQFGVSVFLIVGAGVILKQVRYMRAQNPGFDKAQVVIIPSTEMGSLFGTAAESRRVFEAYRHELAGRSDILGITAVSRPPVLQLPPASIQRHLAAGYHKDVALYAVDSSFVNVLGLTMAAGRDFDPKRAGDPSQAVIINEAMAHELEATDPVGQVLDGVEYHSLLEQMPHPIVIGVVKDFLTRPMHFPVQPAILTLNETINEQIHKRHLLIRIGPNDMPATLTALREAWHEVATEVPFTYSFLDEAVDRQYQAERRWGQIVTFGAIFAMLIACLGLLGNVALSVARRTKEIGIRKVLGASVANVALLVCKNYVRLTGLAALMALPVAYLTMNRWLQHFAYHVPFSVGMLVLTCALVVMATLLTVSYQAIKAALADPVKSLRYE